MEPVSWITANLSYSGNRDLLLVEGVKPIIKELLDKRLVSQFFWVRNRERGPHIRLRFNGKKENIESLVKPLINEHFKTYFQKHPSFRLDSDEGSAKKNWYKNDSVTYSSYDREIERYGGPVGIDLAEQQFQVSSDIVMKVLSAAKQFTTESRLKAAFQLQIGLLTAFELDRKNISDFFDFVYEVRWNRVPEKLYQELGRTGYLKQRKKEIENYFIGRSTAYQEYVKTVFEAFNNGSELDRGWQLDWFLKMRKIRDELMELEQKGALIKRKGWHRYPNVLWPIYESYCHMTHNRLGTRNLFEGYIALIISRGLRE